jgi:PAS domain S-box-containing protein
MNTKTEQFSAANPNPVLSVAEDGTVLYSNEAGEPLLNEWCVRVGQMLPSSIGDFVQEVISRNNPEKVEVKVGNRIYSLNFQPPSEAGRVNIYGIDISEQKELEQKLQLLNEELEAKSRELGNTNKALEDSELKYRQVIENAREGIWSIDRNDRTIFVNKKVSEMLGYSIDEILGQSPQIFIAPEFRPVAEDRLQEHRQRVGQAIDYRFIRKDGSELWCIVSTHQLFDDEGKYAGSLGMLTDITERKNAEETLKKLHENMEELVKIRTDELEKAYISLKESQERLAEAQEISHVGSYDWDILTNEEHWSDELYVIFGLDTQYELNHNTFLSFVHPEDLEYMSHAINEALNGKPYNIEYRIILPGGEERVIHSQGGAVYDEKNIPIRMRGLVQDITERKKAEESLARIEIARKKEIHHRIKNNLQVISSLLDLQAEKFRNRQNIKDSEVLEAFRESQDRVISMALIHEELHKGEGFERLNFSSYIEELADNLLSTYRLGNNDINLCMNLSENILFDIDIAVPLGIIINELVSNSLKHAFPEKNDGEIRINLYRGERSDNRFILTVSDNGIGIPENLDIKKLDSLGIQLITSLVDQLDGELELKRDNGTEFIIKFTAAEKDNKE